MIKKEPFNLLAFDTTYPSCLVALQSHDQMKTLSQNSPMSHARFILPMIDSVLRAMNLSVKDLDAIAYTVGPGSFTGTRIGNSVAQALGFATNKPIIPISSLALVAQSLYLLHPCDSIYVLEDAKMGHFYGALYTLNEGLVVLNGEEKLLKAEDILLSDSIAGGVGNGWTLYSQGARQPSFPIYTIDSLSAQALLKLAKVKYDQKQWVTAEHALPVYLQK